MKNIILLSVVIICAFTANAQHNPSFRHQTPAETAFLNNTHAALSDAIPHTYKDWKTSPESTYDAIHGWCDVKPDFDDCTGYIPKSVGKGDPYFADVDVEFKMPDEQSAGYITAVYGMIKDFSNGPQVATALKSSNKTKLYIFVSANQSVGNAGAFVLSYCAKTPPVNLTLPVPTTLAVKGIRSAECPIMDGGRVSLSGNYYDNAIVFLGKPLTSKKTRTTDDNLTDTRYDIGFDKTKMGKLIVQNVVVTFKGDSADIDEAIKLIDWQKLYALIDKNN
ncbi:hypothetical protein [Mucilaginibacter gilvus]|uniref:Uncharacterized protein n=1 Tax=Mucilaginibacter gilvus TaxID=2305909 RepID=A0A444MR24_9SPHI|nr:hypothetical protein [Mucilaginibacter gilvus]RWY54067.1 hypothetical protein EPL05_08455 [Mucilaginibacter gilvus]